MLKSKIRQSLWKSSNYKKTFTDKGQLKAEAEVVLNDLLIYSGFFKDIGPADGQMLAMMEGRKQVVRRILKMVNFDQSKLIEMEKEENHG